MAKWSPETSRLLRRVGATVAITSLILGLLAAFAWQIGCSVVGSMALVLFGFIFLAGGLVFLVGQVATWRGQKLKPNANP